MANTIIIYQGDGSTTDFAVPFDYLRKSFVRVFLDRSQELVGGATNDVNSDYYFVDPTTIRLRKIVPTNTQTITIRRYTSGTDRVVSFRDGSVLYAKDLDTSQVQAFHIAEESRDLFDDSLNLDTEGFWNAKNTRIRNVGTPIDPHDATTKEYVDKIENDAGIHADSARASAGTAVSAAKVTAEKSYEVKEWHKEVKDWHKDVEAVAEDVLEYSWDIPHLVNSLDEVEKCPNDGYFWVTGFGDPGVVGEDISNRYVKGKVLADWVDDNAQNVTKAEQARDKAIEAQTKAEQAKTEAQVLKQSASASAASATSSATQAQAVLESASKIITPDGLSALVSTLNAKMASDVVVTKGSVSVSRYSDIDTLIDSGIYAIINYTDIAHLPVQAVGTLLCLKGTSSEAKGRIQVYFGGGKIFYRIYWRSAWTDWTNICVPSDVAIPTSGAAITTISAPYDDFNTLPVGIFSYSTSMSVAKNSPVGFNYGSVISMNRITNTLINGGIQIVIGRTGNIAWRINWSNKWSDWTYPLEETDSYASVALFKTIGIVGDSYASGEIYTSNKSGDFYDLSWGQIMARRNGISCTNFSKGGLTTRTWLTHGKGKTLLLSEPPKNLYILALGINDVNKLGTAYIGSSADIASDYNNNADTFWGNYSKIISIIKEHAPNAKIVISTMANTSDNYPAFNSAITELAAYWGIPVLTQAKEKFFNSAYYIKHMVKGHPVGAVYSGMAIAFEKMLSKCMVNNLSYFKDYIG